jgi:hypothetical protein
VKSFIEESIRNNTPEDIDIKNNNFEFKIFILVLKKDWDEAIPKAKNETYNSKSC